MRRRCVQATPRRDGVHASRKFQFVMVAFLGLFAPVIFALVPSPPPPPAATWQYMIRSTLTLVNVTVDEYQSNIDLDLSIMELLSTSFEIGATSMRISSVTETLEDEMPSTLLALSFNTPSRSAQESLYTRVFNYFADDAGNEATVAALRDITQSNNLEYLVFQ
jgi:hypothetical protein